MAAAKCSALCVDGFFVQPDLPRKPLARVLDPAACLPLTMARQPPLGVEEEDAMSNEWSLTTTKIIWFLYKKKIRLKTPTKNLHEWWLGEADRAEI